MTAQDESMRESNGSREQVELQLGDAEQLVEKCRLAGKQGNHKEVIQQAEGALEALGAIEARLAGSLSEHARTADAIDTLEKLQINTKMLTASVHGYMGYGLMKQGHYDNALPCLERSIQLRQEAIKSKEETASQCSDEDIPRVALHRREAVAAERAYEYCREQLNQTNDTNIPLVKYPRTAHLFDTGGTAITADDLVLSENDAVTTALCDGTTCVVIEEKIDGANLGISFDPSTQEFLVQNRSHFISSGEHVQFSRISEWLEHHRVALERILCTHDRLRQGSLILYGEWLAARHSLPYHRLPALFVAYDVFDRNEKKFFSRKRFHTVLTDSGIPVVPVIETRTFGPYTQREKKEGLLRAALVNFLDTKSAFRSDGGTVEGIVLRVDDTESLWLEHRYKVVRPDFIQGCNGEHWSSRSIEKQRIDFEFALEYVKHCYVFAATDDDCSNALDEDAKMPADESTSLPQSIKSARKVSKEAKEYAAQRARARRRVPRCVMLMGNPGSGKSNFANRLAASAPDEWTVVNQDRLGKKKCIALASKVGRKNRVILDRCHPTAAERQEWHSILGSPQKRDIALVYFAADANTCIERVKNRTSHETIPEGRGEKIVKCVAKMLAPPSNEEESLFGTIKVVNTFEESDALLHRWGVDNDGTY